MHTISRVRILKILISSGLDLTLCPNMWSELDSFGTGGGGLRPISTVGNFPQKEDFVKCDWPTQIIRRKQILRLKMFNF